MPCPTTRVQGRPYTVRQEVTEPRQTVVPGRRPGVVVGTTARATEPRHTVRPADEGTGRARVTVDRTGAGGAEGRDKVSMSEGPRPHHQTTVPPISGAWETGEVTDEP